MKSLLLAVLLAVSTVTVAAQSTVLDVSKLTPEQRAEIQLQVERTVSKSADPSAISSSLRNEASQWADLGKNVGTALVASAKEVGQSVNEFSQTPVGQITTAIIVYKVIGKEVLGILIGTIIIVIGTCSAYYIHRKLGISTIVYENIPRFNGLWISKRIVKLERDGDWLLGSTIIAILVLLISWCAGLLTIF